MKLIRVDGTVGRMYRAQERFAFCSTFKTVLGAAVLHRIDDGAVSAREPVALSTTTLQFHSPVVEAAGGSTLTLLQLVRAAVTFSDNTAANLLLTRLGGPARLTQFAHALGDGAFQLTDYEPQLSLVEPGSIANTTTASGMATLYTEVLAGQILTPSSRSVLRQALERNPYGTARIAAGAPGWTVADKTGTGSRGEANDVALLRRGDELPFVLSVFTRPLRPDQPPSEAAIAEATRRTLASL